MPENTLWAIIIGVGVLIYLIYSIINHYQAIIKEKQNKIDQYVNTIASYENNIKQFEHLTETQKLEFKRTEAEIKLNSQKWALEELEKYKTNEIDSIKKIIEKNALTAATQLLQQWKVDNEAKIRQDAANRSYAVHMGKITEHLVPFHVNFPFNPKDARFIGSPIDLIVFDGASDDASSVTIYFVEIKTGKSRLSTKQQKIKSAVLNREVIWHEIEWDSFVDKEKVISSL